MQPPAPRPCEQRLAGTVRALREVEARLNAVTGEVDALREQAAAVRARAVPVVGAHTALDAEREDLGAALHTRAQSLRALRGECEAMQRRCEATERAVEATVRRAVTAARRRAVLDPREAEEILLAFPIDPILPGEEEKGAGGVGGEAKGEAEREGEFKASPSFCEDNASVVRITQFFVVVQVDGEREPRYMEPGTWIGWFGGKWQCRVAPHARALGAELVFEAPARVREVKAGRRSRPLREPFRPDQRVFVHVADKAMAGARAPRGPSYMTAAEREIAEKRREAEERRRAQAVEGMRKRAVRKPQGIHK